MYTLCQKSVDEMFFFQLTITDIDGIQMLYDL